MSADHIHHKKDMLFAPQELRNELGVRKEKNFNKDYFKNIAGLDVAGGALLFIAEMARFRNVNGIGIERYMQAHPDWHPANLSPEWFSLLQNCGDIVPGFVLSAISYWALEGANATIKRRIPENVIVSVAVIAGIAGVAAHEAGYFAQASYSKGTLPDIVFGAIGPIAYGGLRYLTQSLVQDTSERIGEMELMLQANEKRDVSI